MLIEEFKKLPTKRHSQFFKYSVLLLMLFLSLIKELGPEEAPQTIIGREDLVRPTKEQYFYSPDIGQVPEIAVPDFLPDLLGM